MSSYSLVRGGEPAVNSYPVVHEGRTFTPDGAIEPMARPGDRLGCGHRAPRKTDRIFPGYVIRRGRTMCAWCAGRAEQRDFRRSAAYTGYLGKHQVTTWLGAPLARITSVHSYERFTPTGGWYEAIYVQATGPDDSRWHGRSSSGTCLVTLRRCKDRGAS
jgi:hypothetical protein